MSTLCDRFWNYPLESNFNRVIFEGMCHISNTISTLGKRSKICETYVVWWMKHCVVPIRSEKNMWNLNGICVLGWRGHVHGGGPAARRRPPLPHAARHQVRRGPSQAVHMWDCLSTRLPPVTADSTQVNHLSWCPITLHGTETGARTGTSTIETMVPCPCVICTVKVINPSFRGQSRSRSRFWSHAVWMSHNNGVRFSGDLFNAGFTVSR